jgi:hypothetical protein
MLILDGRTTATPGRVGASVNQPEMTAASQESGTPGIWSRHQARGKGYRSLNVQIILGTALADSQRQQRPNEPRDMSQRPESRLSLKHYTGPARRGAWTRPQLPARRANATKRVGAMGEDGPTLWLSLRCKGRLFRRACATVPAQRCRPVLWPWDALRCSYLRG